MATEKVPDKNEVPQDARDRALEDSLRELEEKERSLLENLRSFSEANQRLGRLVDNIGDRVDEVRSRAEKHEEMVRANPVQEVYVVAGEAPEPESSLESESES